MKNFSDIFKNKKIICVAVIGVLILAGCSNSRNEEKQNATLENERTQESQTELSNESFEQTSEKDNDLLEEPVETPVQEVNLEPEIIETDWSKYFDSLSGAAVVYDASDRKYTIYNRELALTQRSPCSTFKIISSLIGLENGIIEPDNSMRTWSGEVFWNENWNHDIDFREAFQQSCVWYFREVIDQIGQERMQEQLNQLQYGNGDISDWEGRLNTNNNNRALTGFWIESSLVISPKEQAEVMARIFGDDSIYSLETQEVADAWFTGFAQKAEEKIYFCVYLGKNEGREVSSSLAKEIAIQLITDYGF